MMNDVRKALIWGIENPPREYTIEEWFIITEFARYVAEHSKESLIEDVKEAMKKSRVMTDTEYEQLQRGMKEFAKGKIGRFGEVPPSITVDDVVYKEPIDTKPIHRINIDNIKAIDCEDGTIYADNEEGLPQYERPIHVDNVRPIKDDRDAEVKIKFKCPDCKYMANDSGEEPCCDCHDSDKYEENDLWGGEGD